MPHISTINTWAACRPSGASLAVFVKHSSELMQDSVDLLLSFVSMVFRDTIWRSHYLGIYKILYADAYLGASCRAGTAHISTIWGLTAQKSPCSPRKIQLGTVGISNDSLKVMAYTGPVYQALGPSHTATRMRHYANFRAARCSSQPGTHLCRATPAPMR